LTFPAIEIPWWNTQTNMMETARIPERVVVVESGGGMTDGVWNQRESLLEPSSGSSSLLPPYTAQIQTGVQGLGIWPWLTGFLAMGWLITGVLWWRHRRSVKFMSEAGRQEVVKSKRSVERNLKQACERGDAQAAKAALLEWGNLQWPGDAPKTIGQIGERSVELFREEVFKLNHILYGYESAVWNGETLWSAFERSTAQETKPSKATDDGLEPLWAT